MPWAIVRPETTAHVQEIMKYANKEIIPVVVRGGGSGMCGQTVPIQGGIILDMKRMNKILEISTVDRLIKVQAGVVTKDLQTKANASGLYYPPNPTSADYCTIGGNIANGSPIGDSMPALMAPQKR